MHIQKVIEFKAEMNTEIVGRRSRGNGNRYYITVWSIHTKTISGSGGQRDMQDFSKSTFLQFLQIPLFTSE